MDAIDFIFILVPHITLHFVHIAYDRASLISTRTEPSNYTLVNTQLKKLSRDQILTQIVH